MDSIWRQKGATLSDKSARQQFGLTQEDIFGAMRGILSRASIASS